MNETEEQEIAAIEAGFKQAVVAAFIRFYEDTDDHTKWGDGAVIRFRTNIVHARAARTQALKVMMEE